MRYDSDGWIFLGYFWWGNGGLVRLALASHISFFFLLLSLLVSLDLLGKGGGGYDLILTGHWSLDR